MRGRVRKRRTSFKQSKKTGKTLQRSSVRRPETQNCSVVIDNSLLSEDAKRTMQHVNGTNNVLPSPQDPPSSKNNNEVESLISSLTQLYIEFYHNHFSDITIRSNIYFSSRLFK